MVGLGRVHYWHLKEGETKLLMDARVQMIPNCFKLRHFAVRHRLIYCIFTSALLMWDFLNTLLEKYLPKSLTQPIRVPPYYH